MLINCETCKGTGVLLEESCPNCGGNGEVDFLDDSFKHTRHSQFMTLQGAMWSALLTDIKDIKDKYNDIFEKVVEIKTVVDAL